MELDRDQKEKLVIDLYKKSKTRPEIAHIVRMSLTTIQSIIKRYTDSLPSQLRSKSSEALTLFKDGLDPLSVAIELDIPAAEAESYYLEYIRLTGLSDLANIYKDIRDFVADFVSFYREVKSRNITIDNVKAAVNASINLPYILNQQAMASSNLQQTQSSLFYTKVACSQLNNQYEILQRSVGLESSKYNSINQQVRILSGEHARLSSIINWLQKSKDYQDLKEIVQAESMSIIKDHDLIIGLSVAAVINALKRESSLTFTNSQQFVGEYTNNSSIYQADLSDTIIKSAKAILDEILTYLGERIFHHTIMKLSETMPTMTTESLRIMKAEITEISMTQKNDTQVHHTDSINLP